MEDSIEIKDRLRYLVTVKLKNEIVIITTAIIAIINIIITIIILHYITNNNFIVNSIINYR